MSWNLFRVRRLILGCLALGGAAVLLVAGFIGYSAYTLPLLRAPTAEQPPAALLYTAGTDMPFAARGVYRGEKIAADHLPADLARAVVAIEDRRFYRHDGVDPRGILRAVGYELTESQKIVDPATLPSCLNHNSISA
jgi:membrane peptidoglycan carboxypeptidase